MKLAFALLIVGLFGILVGRNAHPYTAWGTPYVESRRGFTLFVQSDNESASGPFQCHFDASRWVCRPVQVPF